MTSFLTEGKKTKKGYLGGKNCQKGSQQENYLDGQTSNTTKNTREGQKEIGSDRKGKKQEKEKQQKLFKKKKKKSNGKNQELRNR